jgi:hypothetical protein
MADIIPKRNTWITVILMFLVEAIFIWAWWDENFHHQIKRILEFDLPLVVFFAGSIYFAIHWLVTLKDPAYEYWSARMMEMALFVVIFCIWVAMYGSQYRQDRKGYIQFDKPRSEFIKSN